MTEDQEPSAIATVVLCLLAAFAPMLFFALAGGAKSPSDLASAPSLMIWGIFCNPLAILVALLGIPAVIGMILRFRGSRGIHLFAPLLVLVLFAVLVFLSYSGLEEFASRMGHA